MPLAGLSRLMTSTDRQLPVLDGVAAGAAGLGIGYGVLFGTGIASYGFAIRGLEVVLLGMAALLVGGWLVAAWGVWRRASWGRLAAMVLASVVAVAALGALVGSGYVRVSSGSQGTSVLTLAAALGMIGYLAHPEVRAAFD